MMILDAFPQAAFGSSTSKTISYLPKSDSPQIAWTVDDGCSAESIDSYIQLATENDLRFTFFVYSEMAPWKSQAEVLRPLVDSGQIQLANHSHTHRDLTTLSQTEIKKDLMKCHSFIQKTYGVDARPYFRAPYGALNSKVIEAAAQVGYTRPVSWSSSLVDMPKQTTNGLLGHADICFKDGNIVLSHSNNLVVSKNFEALLALINERNLSLVTLNDVF